jgi:hypothetical protein
VPGGSDATEEPSRWEERMGPVGLFLTAVVACGIGYGAAVWFKLF